MLTSLSNRPQNRRGQRYGDRRIKQVKVLSWFVNDHFKRGLAINITKYEANPVICIENAMLATDYSKDTSTVAENQRSFLIKNR